MIVLIIYLALVAVFGVSLAIATLKDWHDPISYADMVEQQQGEGVVSRD